MLGVHVKLTRAILKLRLIKDGEVINFHPLRLSGKKMKERRELQTRCCGRADDFKCTKDSYICSLHFVGENGPTNKRQIQFQLQLVEKSFVIYVYTVCLHITFYSVI